MIYHGDFRDFRGSLEVSAVITDPPYQETGMEWDKWPEGWPAWLLERVPAAASLWCWGSLRMFLEHAAEFAGWRFAQDNVWEKANGSSLHADRFRRVHELMAHFYPRRAKWEAVFKKPVIRTVQEEDRRTRQRKITRQGKPAHWGEIQREGIGYEYDGTRLARSVMFAPSVREGVRHATPKPVSILRDLVSYSCPAGGQIADIMCGSGSARVAAKELGIRSIGFDADLPACEESAERCSQTMALPEAAR